MEQASLVPAVVAKRIKQHIQHLNGREGIRIDAVAMSKRIDRYSKKASGTSQYIAKQYQGINQCLAVDQSGYWHRPNVSAFHTVTGRDEVLDSSLNRVPKSYWKSVLAPPAGSVYVLLDYHQQEPMIAATLAGCQTLIDWYQEGDIYKRLSQQIGAGLNRDQSKKLLLGRLYGQGVATLSVELQVTQELVRTWVDGLNQVLQPINIMLNRSASDIKRDGYAQSLDWHYTISNQDDELSLRNWHIQATGADIMRRACIGLDKAKIPLLLTNHDSFLIRLEQTQFSHQLNRAKQALTDAAVDVLNGFPLKVAVEMTVPPRNY
ncbi:DNA polymerase [Vibrio alfacsensis]|uniref:DNA polymerase n=1 Tax=Vibrio alfacsensis TaxID=1074311 RepID=UPI0040679238